MKEGNLFVSIMSKPQRPKVVLLVSLESFGCVRVHQVDLIMLLKFEYYFSENLMKNLIFKVNLVCVFTRYYIIM